MLNNMGKGLIFFGLASIALGLIFISGVRIPWLGRLPGDIYLQRKHLSFYFPLASCILLSIILSLIFWVVRSR